MSDYLQGRAYRLGMVRKKPLEIFSFLIRIVIILAKKKKKINLYAQLRSVHQLYYISYTSIRKKNPYLSNIHLNLGIFPVEACFAGTSPVDSSLEALWTRERSMLSFGTYFFLRLSSIMHAKLLQARLTLCGPMDCSRPDFSLHGILQIRILEWVAMLSSRDLPDPGVEPTSFISPARAGGFFTTSATWKAK